MFQIPSEEFRRMAMTVIRPVMSVLIVIALIAALPGLISSTVNLINEADPAYYVTPVMQKMTEALSAGEEYEYDAELTNALQTFLNEKGAIYIPMFLMNALLTPAVTVMLSHALLNAVRKREVSLADALRMLRHAPKALVVEIWQLLRVYVWMLPGMALMLLPMVLIEFFPTMPMLMASLAMLFIGMIAALVLSIRAGLHYGLASIAFADDPSLSPNACIRASWQIMRRRKLEFFFLRVSFIGWSLLVSLLMLIASAMFGTVIGDAVYMMANLFLSVYISAAQVCFYLVYSGKLGPVVKVGAAMSGGEGGDSLN